MSFATISHIAATNAFVRAVGELAEEGMPLTELQQATLLKVVMQEQAPIEREFAEAFRAEAVLKSVKIGRYGDPDRDA